MEASDDPQQAREQAIERLKKKREFRSHVYTYLAVNTLLVVIWATSGGFFWPIFPIVGWGLLGIGPHAYDVYFRRPFTEEEIRRETQRMRR